MPPYSLLDPVVLVFLLMPPALVAGLAWGVWYASVHADVPGQARRRSVGVVLAGALWIGATGAVASTGILRDWEAVPPPFVVFALTLFALGAGIAFGPWGRLMARGVPLWALVAAQSFRLPLELAMHGLATDGVMPEQMSYTGRNLDILTGASAIVLAWLLRGGRVGRRVAAVWSLCGFGLLVNIVTIAILSTPPFGYFGEDRLNTFVTYVPFVWLPAVMVMAALAGHLVIWRALRQDYRRPATDR